MNQNEEKWKDIEDFEGLYAVSDRGRVMNLKSGKILKPRVNSQGYAFVGLHKNGKSKQCTIHRLTADAFIENPNNLAQVNHIDENKRNNDVKNLEWVTASQNNRYSKHKQTCKINQYNLDGELIRVWGSFHEIEEELGYFASSIRRCCKGKSKKNKAYDYRWKYADELQQRRLNRPVIALSTEDDFISQFKNVPEASRCLGIPKISIWFVLRGTYKTIGMFYKLTC